jgi:colicin import membrane protein
MAEKNESSVLFSLQELMNLEEERIHEEESERAAREQAERERQEAEARAKREAEERRIQEEEERRRQEELRKREEEARLEAIKQAEIAKAQQEAEHRARMEALARQQEHEQRLAALQADQGKKKLKMAVGAAVAVLLVGAVGGGVAFKNAQEKAEKEKALLMAEAERVKSEADAQVRKLEETLKNNESMSEAQRLALEKDLEEARKKAAEAAKDVGKPATASSPSRSSSPRPAPASKPAPSRSACAPGDPLCVD